MPASATRPPRPLAVLFACGQNSVRSPIAAGLFAQMFGRSIYVGSAGVRKGELDPFAIAVMAEIGLDISTAQARHFRGARRIGGAQFRSDHHAVAGSASPGAGIDPHQRASRSNIGRRPIRPSWKAAASSGSKPIGRSAIS